MTVLSVAAGSSVVSALITTYATQSGERREARAHVRESMRPAEMAALGHAPASTSGQTRSPGTSGTTRGGSGPLRVFCSTVQQPWAYAVYNFLPGIPVLG